MPSRSLSPMHPNRPALPSLTGLRWVAAFVVFLYHTGNAGYFSGNGQAVVEEIFRAGPTGVSLFFVLSGFVLAWSDDAGTSILAFWRRRFARIVPVHLVVLVGALILAATAIPYIRTDDPWAVLANASLVSSWNPDWWQAGNPVSWSLVCEAFFYLAFPLIIRAIRPLPRESLAVLAAIALVLVVAVPAMHDHLPPAIAASSSPLGRLPEFLLGVTLGRLMATGYWRGPRLLVGATTTIVGYSLAAHLPSSPFTNSSYTVVGFALLVSGLARSDMEKRPTILSSRAFVHLGKISFSFYLMHVLILQSIVALYHGAQPGLAPLPAMILTTAALLLAITAAHLMHRFVETPARRILEGAEGPCLKDGRMPRVREWTAQPEGHQASSDEAPTLHHASRQ